MIPRKIFQILSLLCIIFNFTTSLYSQPDSKFVIKKIESKDYLLNIKLNNIKTVRYPFTEMSYILSDKEPFFYQYHHSIDLNDGSYRLADKNFLRTNLNSSFLSSNMIIGSNKRNVYDPFGTNDFGLGLLYGTINYFLQ